MSPVAIWVGAHGFLLFYLVARRILARFGVNT